MDKLAIKLESLANEMENNYANNPTTEQYNLVYSTCVDSVQNVLKMVQVSCNKLSDDISSETKKIDALSTEVSKALLNLDISKELSSRKLLGNKALPTYFKDVSNIYFSSEPVEVNKPLGRGIAVGALDNVGQGPYEKLPQIDLPHITVPMNVPASAKSAYFIKSKKVNLQLTLNSRFWDDESDISAEASEFAMKQKRTSNFEGVTHASTMTKSQRSTFKKQCSVATEKRYGTSRKSNGTIRKGAPTIRLDPTVRELSNNVYNTITLKGYRTDAPLVAELPDQLFNSAGPFKPRLQSVTLFDETSSIGSSALKGSLKTIQSSISEITPSYSDTKKNDCLYQAKVLFDYTKNLDDEISLISGNIVEVLHEEEDGWLVARCNNLTGLIPGNYIQRI